MQRAAGVMRVRRTYNQWVANETLEDFALRFTARRARKWSYGRVANTAIGSISFLALEAIGGALTLSYGFDNAMAAILAVGTLLFLTALPISYHAARTGVDIDLLTRGAGFGYIGSTMTSLIYASFTFIFFALEAAILSQALELCFGVPLWLGYLLNTLVVIPLVTHGFARIGMFQKWTQPFWVVLQIVPFLVLAAQDAPLEPWISHTGRLGDPEGGVDLLLAASAAGVAFSLVAQIGEQVDFLRFLPEPRTRGGRLRWWVALMAAGPGWAALGTLKMLAGSFLAVLILEAGVPAAEAVEPTKMYLAAFERFAAPEAALLLTGLFVVLSQLKINVTNAYAGSIAWSNFFSRLTHSHPGRVVWLVFNVAIALMLLQFGVFGALEQTLALYGHVAVAWIGAITADLTVNKPLGLAPKGIEFRRAYLYDVNPVGVGSMALATTASLAAYLGPFGPTAEAFSSFIALGVAFVTAPAIALATRGRFYLARPPERIAGEDGGEATCVICEHRFDPDDMAQCPFHDGAICSLCCSLEARCADACKPHATLDRQAAGFADRFLPARIAAFGRSRYGMFTLVAGAFAGVIGLMLLMIREHAALTTPEAAEPIGRALALVFGLLVIVVGVAAWLHTLARESRVLANEERERQTALLSAEIRAHERTDAELKRAKDEAVAANAAKSRYVVGISHELRTPLNAILGYAQLMEADPTIPPHRRQAVKMVRRSSEHLADLIEGLLDISKIEAGRLEVYRDTTALRELLDHMAAICRMEAEEKRLGFTMRVDASVPERVRADSRRLRQILMNLLSNAVRYTDAGEVRLDVSYRNQIATFRIEDTGRGIAPEDRERIFQPFERIQRAEAPVRGAGLGLTITKLLVDMLGGDLQFDSAPGRGSVFTVRLMLPRLHDEAPAAETAPRVYGYRGPRRRLLVAEDNPDHRAFLEDALRPLGFELSLAESGEAALAMLDAAPCDLALVDVAMPGMSGWALAAALRARGFVGPVVMLSAHAADQRARLAPDIAAGDHHDDFIAKPVKLETLLASLERHLRLDWALDAPAEAPHAPVRAESATLDALSRHLSIGHVRGFEREIDAAETAGAGSPAFFAEARRRLESLDLSGLAALLAEARDEA